MSRDFHYSVPPPARPAAWHGLAAYVSAAAFARIADGGAVVAIVLLAEDHGNGGVMVGVLAACITAPHLLGPLLARWIDRAADTRKVIAAACVLYALALAAAVVTFGYVAPWFSALLLVVVGLFGPLLTGGISSQLPALAGTTQRQQRRAQGWDVATYGLGGTIGPALVAVVSAVASAACAALCLAGATLAAAALVMCLPHAAAIQPPTLSSVPRVWQTMQIMVKDGRLRRTLYLTMLVAFSVAALPVTAIHLTKVLGIPAASAGELIAAYGIGTLVGSMGVMWRPLTGSPDNLMAAQGFAVGLALIAISGSQDLTTSLMTFFAAGVLNAYFFAATLAARSEYAPVNMRNQVFLWVAALKISAGAAGTAAAGALTVIQARVPLLVGAAVICGAVALSLVERNLEGWITPR